MRSQRITFPNAAGQQLSARLEQPVNQHAHTYALFAHCFTCNKNLTAVRNISRALTQAGVAVLRFDFTGLGDSEGDFVDTNFTSNVEDLVAAAQWLAEHHEGPRILIGHSLGGAAVLCAAGVIPTAAAVATIGAPFDPTHVAHLFGDSLERIEKEGRATVTIGGRSFDIDQQFIDDLEANRVDAHIKDMRKPLLVMHSPQDRTVEIENARLIYDAAHHPKSFVTLDGADHLLTNKADSLYAGELIATWSKRYINLPEKEKLKADKQVAVRLGKEGFTTDIAARQHTLTADEPEKVGGNDFGPTPYELVAAGLGACTAMTMQMYARRKGWVIDEVRVQLHHFKDYADDMAATLDEKPKKMDHFERVITLEGELDEGQRTRLLEIADRCPVHRTLHEEVVVRTTLTPV